MPVTAIAQCTTVNRTTMQESIVFRPVPTPSPSPPVPPVAGKPPAPKAPAPPKPATFQGTLTIFDPAQMGQYVPGQTYNIDIGK